MLYTSLLRRAINTANLALDKADRHWIPVHRDWRLNERHYGALQGLNKAETKAKYGEEQFMAWRRSYDTPPPPIERGSKYSQDADPRYADIDGGPLTECLKDVVDRFVPYYDRDDRARPAGRQDRADRRARQLAARAGEVPRRHVRRGRRRAEHPDRASRCATTWTATSSRRSSAATYLDPEAAAAGAAAVAAPGRQVDRRSATGAHCGKHWVNGDRTPAIGRVTCPVLAARCWDDVHRMRTIFA